MATKSQTPTQPNVVILDPETDEIMTTNDTNPLAEITSQIEEARKSGAKRIRYSDEQKAIILKWIEDYDAANGRGGASQIVKILGISPISLSQWKGDDGTPKERKTRTPKTSEIKQTERPEVTLLKVLKTRGFDVKISIDALDPKSEPEIHVEKSIEKIMEFVPYYNSNGRFEIGLDQLLTMLKLPLNK